MSEWTVKNEFDQAYSEAREAGATVSEASDHAREAAAHYAGLQGAAEAQWWREY